MNHEEYTLFLALKKILNELLDEVRKLNKNIKEILDGNQKKE